MPSKKKKYNTRFPVSRIKKIMQSDEDVGKVAQAVPVIISRTLELFVHSLLTKTMQITSAKNAKTLSPSHMKQCILSESRFDFLKDLVKGLPDISGADEEVPTPPMTPAPMSVNPLTVVCPPAVRHSEASIPKEVQSCEISISRRNSKDIKGIGSTSTVVLSETAKVASTPSAPEFQISVPTSFQISQPNFYTEVNPINLSSHPSNMSTNDLPTSNFTHTANIDEDYDT
ncbi:dr1-associated corepressor [Cephus cinctus]|uniref:Dr1-associated corepressor n=1 Tax=Cephus cinctus TaxID=211228 RepID=A0AAJ7BY55_CEPCN|nr:dr1-associated corepressor [Cephus cinctus]